MCGIRWNGGTQFLETIHENFSSLLPSRKCLLVFLPPQFDEDRQKFRVTLGERLTKSYSVLNVINSTFFLDKQN